MGDLAHHSLVLIQVGSHPLSFTLTFQFEQIQET